MDGIARNTSRFDADVAGPLTPIVTGATLLLVLVLVLAFVAELLRRGGLASGVVHHLDHVLPGFARRIAVATLTFSVVVVGPSTAGAVDAPVRDWLSGAGADTTTTTTTTSTTRAIPTATEDQLIERATVPTTAPVPATTAPPTRPGAPAPPNELRVVVDGDCLWSIAADRLGPDASNAAIDAAWRAIYALNRDGIGDDPNLIFPGLQLELPPIDPSPLAAP